MVEGIRKGEEGDAIKLIGAREEEEEEENILDLLALFFLFLLLLALWNKTSLPQDKQGRGFAKHFSRNKITFEFAAIHFVRKGFTSKSTFFFHGEFIFERCRRGGGRK